MAEKPTTLTIDDCVYIRKDSVPTPVSAPSNGHPYPVGKNVFVRGVAMYYTGRLTQVTTEELVLEDAAWIPSTGRFSDALLSGVFSEVEPYPAGPVILSRGGIMDVSLWSHSLPRTKK